MSDVHLVLVAGWPGCGKTHIAYEICRKTKFTYLDKDTLNGLMVDQMLIALGSPLGSDERDSEIYAKKVRPLEYECLMTSVIENISLGISTVVSAPLINEFSDPHWRMNLKHDCETALGRTVLIHYVWVHAEEQVMKRRMIARRASRDTYKLENWDAFYKKTLGMRPMQPCFEMDCSADHASEYRAMQIIGRFALLGAEGYVER